MAKYVFHNSTSRGFADHGWLKANHSFSFANFYNPEKIHFGALRVLNDDFVEGGMGFGTHPHDNMEIITIPLEGDLEHRDSMGNGTVIKYGDVQVMSAGTGIKHSEFNANKDKPVKLLQIWIFPIKKNVTPRYQQVTLDADKLKNNLHQIVSPNIDDDGVWIHQDAWMHLTKLSANQTINYSLKKSGNGVYAFLISGEIKIDDHELKSRDAIGIWETNSIEIKSSNNQESHLLLIEVPMQFAY